MSARFHDAPPATGTRAGTMQPVGAVMAQALLTLAAKMQARSGVDPVEPALRADLERQAFAKRAAA
jgi:hypothetical protein